MSKLILITMSGLSVLPLRTAAGQGIPPQGEVHDRIVAVMHRVIHREVAAGDTFVTWSPNPVLYTTVRWIYQGADGVQRISSSLSRADSMVGTSDAIWMEHHPISVTVKWTKPDSVLLDFRASIEGGMIRISGQSDEVIEIPDSPWAIADYGMEDQLLPLLPVLDEHSWTTIRVYRPFVSKWDVLRFQAEARGGARVVAVEAPDGEVSYWVVTGDNALVRITRSEHAEVERRPLEMSPRFAEYLRYRALGELPGRN